MSFQKFKPEVWSAKFMDDLDKTLVFKENCNHSYEGDAKKAGDAVRILTLGDVSVRDYHDGRLHRLDAPQDVTGGSMLMPINEVRDFNFFIDDLDKAQAQGGSGLMSKYTAKAKDKMADEIDTFIAGLHVGETEEVQYALSHDGQASGSVDIITAIDNVYLKLLENNVSRSTKVTLTAPPWFIMMLKRAYVELDTDNSAMLANGRVGRYGGIILKESNNVYYDGEWNHIQLKTDEAIAFANPYTHMEGYRPNDYFRDAVKGYTIFDGKVVAQNQCIDFKVKRA